MGTIVIGSPLDKKGITVSPSKILFNENNVNKMIKGDDVIWIAEPIALIPIMTSNNTPSGECFGSSILGSDWDYYKAFDDKTTDYWHGTNQATEYVGYKFTSPHTIQKFRLIPQYGSTGLFCKHYKIQGSNNGNEWEDLYEETIAINSTYDVTKETTQNRGKSYLYVRVYIDSSYESSAGGKSVKLFQVYGY